MEGLARSCDPSALSCQDVMMGCCSLGGDAELNVRFLLFLRECAEETDFLLAWRFPLVIRFKCALQVRLDVHVKGLRL